MMSEEEFKMIKPHYILINTENKKPVLVMKSKSKYGYFLLQRFEENLTEGFRNKYEEVLGKTKILCAALRMPLYDTDEIMEALEHMVDETLPDYPKQIDVKISIFNHATGKVNELTIGMSKGMKKDGI